MHMLQEDLAEGCDMVLPKSTGKTYRSHHSCIRKHTYTNINAGGIE